MLSFGTQIHRQEKKAINRSMEHLPPQYALPVMSMLSLQQPFGQRPQVASSYADLGWRTMLSIVE